MTNYPQPSQDEIVRAVYGFAAGLMREGRSEYQIEKALVDKGIDTESARGIVSNLSRMRSEAIRKAALKNMAIGAAICVVGIIVTFGTYSAAAASSRGGSYVVAWGAIIFGGLRFFRALSQYNQ
jgi:hypothetical protein